MPQFAEPPAIVQVQPDTPVVTRSRVQAETEKLQKALKESVAITTDLAQRGQEQARSISTMEERTRNTLRELIVSVGRKDGSES